MSGNQDNGSFSGEKVSRAYSVLTLLMFALMLAAGYLQYTINVQQKFLVQAVSAARQQFALTQRMDMAVAGYQSTRDDKYLKVLKDAAGAGLNNHDALMPVLLSDLPAGAGPTPGLVAVRTLIDESFTYAVSPYSAESQANVPLMAEQAINGIPDAWNAEVARFADARQQRIDLLEQVFLAVCALLLGLTAYGAFGLVIPALGQIARQREHLDHLAATDPLTATYNRAMLFKVTAGLISSARRYKHDMTALAIDIDGLGKINESSGRAAGDGAIRMVAKAMAAHLRTSDLIGRVGGGEFGVFLPSTDEYHAGYVAEKLRAAVEEAPFAMKDRVILLRVSIGIAQMLEHHKSPDDLLRAAEVPLCAAKDAGRNRVAASGAPKADAPGAP